MCHPRVIQTVKQRLLSRRDLFRTAGVVATSTTALAAGTALARAPSRIEDLTYTLSPAFPTYSGEPGFAAEQTFDVAEHGFNQFDLSINEHTGTHIDAPLHVFADGAAVDEIPVASLVAPLVVIDIRTKAIADHEAQVTPDDIKAWIAVNGALPAGCCVAMDSGWSLRVDGPGYRNVDGGGTMRFPGFHAEAALMLIEEAECVGLAVDTLSLDIGSSTDFATHTAWLPSGRWGIENIARLDQVPAAGATLVVGAPKHRGGTGGPTRVLALV